MIVATTTPITTPRRARGPSMTRIPTATPDAGQKTATSSASRASPTRAAKKYAIATPTVQPSERTHSWPGQRFARDQLALKAGRTDLIAPQSAKRKVVWGSPGSSQQRRPAHAPPVNPDFRYMVTYSGAALQALGERVRFGSGNEPAHAGERCAQDGTRGGDEPQLR
jgi:hypothetical protein